MKKNNLPKGFALPIVIVAIALLVIGYFVTRPKSSPTSDTVSVPLVSEKTLPDGTVVKPDGTMVKKDGIMVKSEDVMKKEEAMKKTGTYENYATSKLANAATGNVVLFFRASWCPTCRTLDTDLKNNLKNIPENLTILDVDYDNSTALKQKYGVTYQHTLVQVDKDGNLIKKWSGNSTLASLVGQIK